MLLGKPHCAVGVVLALAVVMGAAVPALAQQITGVLGSPDAKISIGGQALPPASMKFGGVIKERETAVHAVVAAAGGAAQGRAQRAADHDR